MSANVKKYAFYVGIAVLGIVLYHKVDAVKNLFEKVGLNKLLA